VTDLREVDPTAAPGAAIAADAADERLIRVVSPADYVRQLWSRVKGGELGMMPVVLGLIIICTVFYAYEPTFLSSRSLVTMMQFAAPGGIIALGIVIVLLLG
jgi:D-xylose transport system permease protein